MRSVIVVASIAVAVSAARGRALDEIRVLSAVGMRQALQELQPAFERSAGHTLVLTFESSGLIPERLQSAEHAHVVLINERGLDQLIKAGTIVTESARPVATSRVGFAVRSGATKPDISTADAFKRSLLAARMVAYPNPALEGSSGLHLASVMERLGIAAQMKTKTVFAEPPGPNATTPASLVATGRADIALHQIQELIAVRGVDVVGPLPTELQQTFTFSAAIVRGGADMAAARTLIAFLQTPHSRGVILAKGMGTPAH
jgi:molybdate transport system substrate-binding protein